MDAIASTTAKTRQRWRAIGLMLAAVLVFSLMDAGLKQLTAHYPPFQIAALRGASSLPFVLIWSCRRSVCGRCARALAVAPAPRRDRIVMMAAFVYALRTLPLSTAYSIFFVAPLLITALSVPFLGEKVGRGAGSRLCSA